MTKRHITRPEPTPCDDGRSRARYHGTGHACRIWGCRCVAAWRKERDRKARWLDTPGGQAYTARRYDQRRAALRGPDGLTSHQRFQAELRTAAAQHIARGHTAQETARRIGVSSRTVERWRRAWRERAALTMAGR